MKYKIYLLSIAFVAFFAGCNKDYPNPDTNDCQDVVLAEGTYNDATNIMDEAAFNGRLPLYADVQTPQDLSACASITHSLTNLDTIIVDFGPSDCICSDNRYRRGQIIATLSSWYFDSTIVNGVVLSFNKYYVNDNLVQGTKTITFKGRNSSTHNYEFSSTTAGKITNKMGQTMTWNASEKKVVMNQQFYTDWIDAVYHISGSGSGTGFNGTTYTSSITTDLVTKGACSYITSGIMSVTPAGQSARIVNFGNDACDRYIDVTLDGNHYNINQQ